MAKTPSRKSSVRKKLPSKPDRAAKLTQIVHDQWDTYVAQRDGTTMFISFDDLVTRGKPPAGLKHCARILIPVRAPSKSGGPSPLESEQLYEMEDELVALLGKHKVPCRLVGRLTYGGWREIVFQLRTWGTFRAPVGLWMMNHEDYEIDVSEHEGWDFFDNYLRPTAEDRLFLADRSVIESLLKSGSNPRKKHVLDFAFQGDAKGLKHVAQVLVKRDYKPAEELDFDSGVIEFSKRLALDLELVNEESLANLKLAEKAGVEFLGWGAAVVE